jgi:hypothetical protein
MADNLDKPLARHVEKRDGLQPPPGPRPYRRARHPTIGRKGRVVNGKRPPPGSLKISDARELNLTAFRDSHWYKCHKYLATDSLKPLGPRARKLASRFSRLKAFWDGRKIEGDPLEYAAEVHLGLSPKQARNIERELDLAGGPLEWLRSAFVAALAAGDIYPALKTDPDKAAEAFYATLAGGRKELHLLERDHLDRKYPDLDATHELPPYEGEILRHLILRLVVIANRRKRA